MNAEQKYPLPARERRLLVQNLLANDAVFFVIGGLLFSLAIGVSTGDWTGAFGRCAVSVLASKLMGFSWFAVAGPLAVVAVLEIGERIIRQHSEDSDREDMLEIRQGINGEQPHLELSTMLLMMIDVGLAEELLFRVGIIDLTRALLGLVANEQLAPRQLWCSPRSCSPSRTAGTAERGTDNRADPGAAAGRAIRAHGQLPDPGRGAHTLRLRQPVDRTVFCQQQVSRNRIGF